MDASLDSLNFGSYHLENIDDSLEVGDLSESSEFNVQNRIREIIDMSNMTPYKLAKLCNVPRSTVSRWINSNHCMTLKSIETLCKGLNITLSDFFAPKNMYEFIESDEYRFSSSWKLLSKEQQEEVLDFIDFIVKKGEVSKL